MRIVPDPADAAAEPVAASAASAIVVVSQSRLSVGAIVLPSVGWLSRECGDGENAGEPREVARKPGREGREQEK